MTEATHAILKAIEELSKRVEAIEARGGGSGKKTIWEITQIMEAKKHKAEALKNSYCRVVAMGPEWTDREKFAEFKKLKAEIGQLTEQLSNMQ